MELRDFTTESLAWGDYDNDGDPDLYLTIDGTNRLFRNEGPTGMGGEMVWTDVTALTGVGHTGWSVGTAFGDLDNDGDLDLYMVTFNTGPDLLYRNNGPIGPDGEHTFTDVATMAGISDLSSSRGMTLLDYDRDGLLDIYVNAIGPDLLYYNLGGLTFTNVAGTLGVGTEGQGVGAVATDFDNNGRIDLFTGNRSSLPNRLYRNNSGALSDVTAAAGINATGLGMGVLAFDHDNDLDLDLYWTAWPGIEAPVANAFYENLGNSTFLNVAGTNGTGDVTGWGISVNAGDIDNDGFEDFAVSNGFSPESSANVLFHNLGDGTFANATLALQGGAFFDGRGVAFADFDVDGDLDLAITGGPGASTRLWRNDTVNGHHWLTLALEGSASNRSAIGARIEVETDLRTVVKEVSGGAGRGSQNDLPVEFGLGAATMVKEVRIRWPNGYKDVLVDVAMDQKLTVVESVIFSDGFESGDTSRWIVP
jgi:hypothetical protein